MIKSQFGQASSRHAVVGPSDVGREVAVVGIGRGLLRYVGGISGKEGLFCGVELEAPEGKHDGTFQGFQYFVCPPQHGIFAPLYKVELAVSPEPHMSNSNTFTRENTARLSRSALPALQLTSVCRPAEPQIQIERPPRERSLSRDSRPSDSSMCSSTASSGSLMNNSMKLSMEEEEDLLTMEIPKGKTLLRHLVYENDQQLCTSMTLPESRVGVENLPVIEDGDETEQTPLVESRPPFHHNYYSNPMMSAYHPDLQGAEYLNGTERFSVDEEEEEDHDAEYDDDGDDEPMAFSSHTFNIVTEQLDISMEEPRAESSASDRERPSGADIGGRSQAESDQIPSPPKATPAEAQTPTIGKSKPMPKMTAAALKRMEAAKKIEKEPKEAKAKKPSVRELQAAAAQPKFPVKPKAPSKHQLMMEQIKASIEAEKNRPKKEKKERASLLPPPPPPKPKQDENVPSDPVMTVSPSAPRGAPLRQVNTAAAAPAKAAREPRKPRQSLLPPAPAPKVRKEESAVRTSSVPSKRSGSVASVSSTASSTKPRAFPTSSFGRSAAASKTTSPAKKAAKCPPAKQIDEREKLRRLRDAVRGFEVLCLLQKWQNSEATSLSQQLEESRKETERRSAQAEELRSRLSGVESEYRGRAEETNRQIEQLTRAHEKNIENTKRTFEKQLDEKAQEHDRALDEERVRHEGEVAALTRRHQNVCGQLDEKILEAEQVAEGLKKDKMALQAALAKDQDSKVQMLTAEISSLQTALSLKSHEMKELRQHNQALIMQIEEIPSLQIEISKLKHKVNELRQSLDQKRNVEKALVSQNEELKRTAQQISQMNQSIIQGMDVLRYQIEEKGEAPIDTSIYQTPLSSKVSFRPRPSGSAPSDRQSWTRLSSSSMIHPELPSQNAEEALNRSTVSMYATHRLSGLSGTDEDVIYAPDEVLSSSTGSARRKNSLSSSESDHDRTYGRVPSAQTDSGIGF